jgi:3-hydroxy-9,10-secoandrosta-1,3,5(10)-triene-9,17-dione monooxygenase
MASERNEVDLDIRVEARLAAAATIRASRRIITHVCDGAGASVYISEHPLQRLQRDGETLKGHVMFDCDRTAELAGKHALSISLGEYV